MKRIVAYLDERTPDGLEMLELLKRCPYPFSIVPTSCVPEVVDGLARYVGKAEVTLLMEKLETCKNET